MSSSTTQERAPARTEPHRTRGAFVAASVVVAVVAVVAFLTAAGAGPTCPAVFPPPEGCEPERGLSAVVAIGVGLGAVLGAGTLALTARRLPTRARAAILVGVVAAGVLAVAWTAALRG
ncbi:hypothetical protein ACT17Q_14185 [Cellulomonas sp. CW35]|uniref:hypothetical protein n=1 Tax=Cellulomonas sp. CW35 TaxID=3458249 RepID=UPI0022801E89